MRHFVRLLLLLPFISGCSNLGFYLQAVSGHMEMMSRRQPVAAVIADGATTAELREQLRLATLARDYASNALGLPDNDSYRSYADLQRPYITWNVVAAQEFSLEARVWCYVHMVCLPYRGYFDEAEAQAYARKLKAEDYDVHVYGVAAYSTSGWFDDPLLNTMLRQGDRRLVRLIFHELAHQQLFLKRDGAFSEAFATFVEQEGWRRWLLDRGDAGALASEHEREARRLDFIALLRVTRERLQSVFDTELEPTAKRAAKAAVFARMHQDYAALRQAWGGYAGYDGWFAQPLNNARLVSIATYHDWVPSFAGLLASVGGDIGEFYRAAAELAELPQAQRRSKMRELAGGAAGFRGD